MELGKKEVAMKYLGYFLIIVCLMWAIIMAIIQWDVPFVERLVNEWQWWLMYAVIGVAGWRLAFNPRLFGGGK